MNFEIIYENADFLVLNKPSGIATQGDHQEQSLISKLNETQTLYPVHRLDKGTSGVLVLAKTITANQALSQAFANKLMQKEYLAIAAGKPKKKQGWVIGDMDKARRGAFKLLRSKNSPAKTYFDSHNIEPGIRLYHLTPHTGKTHQLRVAMKSLGTPIYGDDLYGDHHDEELMLHAWKLSFEFNGKLYQFCAPCRRGLFSHEQVKQFMSDNIGEYKPID